MVNLTKKIRVWIKRYFPAEICGLCGSMVSGTIASGIIGSNIITAFAGAWGENIGYYGYLFASEFRKIFSQQPNLLRALSTTMRNLVIEFGPAEVLDSLIVRPTSIYLSIRLLNHVPLGLMLGKICADVIFYIPTIIIYEIRNHWFTNKYGK